MNKALKGILIVLAIALVAVVIFSLTPSGRIFFNQWGYAVQKADDNTNYNTLKKVEDTCRVMISSYKTDVLIYRQYIDSDNEEERSWANQAKIRANKTANTYNEFILKNKYIWKDNVPVDIVMELPII